MPDNKASFNVTPCEIFSQQLQLKENMIICVQVTLSENNVTIRA